MEVAVDHVEVGPADAACMDSQQNLARPRPRIGQLLQPKRLPLLVKDHRAHPPIIPDSDPAQSALIRLDDLVQGGALRRLAAGLFARPR